MKRMMSMLAMAAMLFGAGALALTHSSRAVIGTSGVAFADSAATAAPAEEKKETPAQEKAEEKNEAKTAKAHKMKAPAMPKVDLNEASKEDLMKLPGVTEDTAEKIVAGRPYTSKSELVSKKILTAAEYSKVKGKLMLKKQKAAATAK